MRLLDRYLIRTYLRAWLYCVALFFVLFIIIDSFNNLDDFLRNNVALTVIGSYYLYYLPSVFVELVPAATLVSLLFVLGSLNRHNEIIAMKASGVGTSHVLLSCLFFGALLCLGVFLFNETVVPNSLVTSTAIKEALIEKGKKNLRERAIENVTLYGKDGRMLFAREYEILSQTLHDVVILEDGGSKTPRSKWIAKKAYYDKENRNWVFKDVMRYNLNPRGDMSGDPSFSSSMTVDLSESPESFIKDASQVEFMSAAQLKTYIRNFKGPSDKLIRRLWVDYHYKMALPFASFVLILIGAPLAMKLDHRGVLLGTGASLMLVVLYYGMFSICLALGKGGVLSPWLAAWLSNAAFGLAGVYLIKSSG
ncbi:MAG: LptF/LptG family permease [Candidatus Omnitrophica bacterium]|nr:LptF/LptG family permease [Candidatus Omnitrophota bacterium]